MLQPFLAREEARDLAKLSVEERRQKLLERKAYAEMAMEEIAKAPAFATSMSRLDES